MATFRQLLRRALEHRARRLTVITLTLLVLLAGLGMAADKYFDLAAEQQSLTAELETAQREATELEGLRKRQSETTAALAKLQEMDVNGDVFDRLRDDIVQTVRKHRCQFRRIEVNAPQSRPWKRNDHPLIDNSDEEVDGMSAGSGFDLRSQELSLEVTGKLTNLKALLDATQSMPHLLYVGSVKLSPDPTTKEVQMRLSIRLFGLEKAKPSEDAGPLPPGPDGAPPPSPDAG